MSGESLPLVPVATNSGGLARVPGLHEDNLQRDIGLTIRLDRDRQGFTVGGYGPAFPPPATWDSSLPLTPVEVFGHVQDCRDVWGTRLVDYAMTGPKPGGGQQQRLPFQDHWDLAAEPQLLKAILPRLAQAGDRLFYHLFEEPNVPDLHRLAAKLREAASQQDRVMTITSDAFFVPWGMIYTHPADKGILAADGSNACVEGFWGYRHIIEHNPMWVNLDTEIRPLNGRLRTGFNIDDRLDTSLNVACIAPQRAYVQGTADFEPNERTLRAQLETAFTDPAFADQVIYFCCHGEGGDASGAPSLKKARLTLSDGAPFTGDEISYWLRNKQEFDPHPIVFINACQGGQMTTIFYETLAAALLKRKAIALVGSQIDIPAVFAAEYAIRLFRRFVEGSRGSRVRLGPTMRELAREFCDRHHTPLGFVYSLYRGADCFIRWP